MGMLYKYKCPKCSHVCIFQYLVAPPMTIECDICLNNFEPEGVIVMPELPDSSRIKERHGSQTFYNLLEKMSETHDRKSHDYASNEDPYGNYHFAGLVSSMFAHSAEDAGFAGRVAEKIYRLANLESSTKSPKNESIEDTELDIATIVVLWMSDRRDRRMKKHDEEYHLTEIK